MHCDDFLSNIHPFLDDELDAADATAMLQHMEDCPVCGDMIRQYEIILDDLSALRLEEPPAILGVRWRAAVRKEARQARAKPFWLRMHGWASVAAAAAMVVMMVSIPFMGTPADQLALQGASPSQFAGFIGEADEGAGILAVRSFGLGDEDEDAQPESVYSEDASIEYADSEAREEALLARMGARIVDSWRGMPEMLANSAVAVAGAIPWLIFWIPMGVIILFFIRLFVWNRRKRTTIY